jgi:hypothetical protein
MAKSTKPSKPFPGFPLYAHATGRWAKKIRGKLHYFGSSLILMALLVFLQGMAVDNVGLFRSQHGRLEFTLSAIAFLG